MCNYLVWILKIKRSVIFVYLTNALLFTYYFRKIIKLQQKKRNIEKFSNWCLNVRVSVFGLSLWIFTLHRQQFVLFVTNSVLYTIVSHVFLSASRPEYTKAEVQHRELSFWHISLGKAKRMRRSAYVSAHCSALSFWCVWVWWTAPLRGQKQTLKLSAK